MGAAAAQAKGDAGQGSLSQKCQPACVGFIPRPSHIYPTLSLTSTGRCLQPLFHPKHKPSSVYTGSVQGQLSTPSETCGRHWAGRTTLMEISTSAGKRRQWLSFPLLSCLILFLLSSSEFCSLFIIRKWKAITVFPVVHTLKQHLKNRETAEI